MDLNTLVAYDGKLIPYIKAQQNSLRLLKIIPTWQNFTMTDAYRDFQTKGGITITEIRKYRAMWNLLFELPRDRKDHRTIALAFCYLVSEIQRRGGDKPMRVDPIKYGIKDTNHSERVKEYVLKHFQDLVPPQGGPMQQNLIIRPE